MKANIDFSSLPQKAPEYDLKVLFELGCHFGHQTQQLNPKMLKFIYTQKGGAHIINLEKTAEYLKKAYNYLYSIGKQNKKVLFVSTKKQIKPIIIDLCTKENIPYVSSRWLGGFFTNWEQIKKSIKKMRDIEKNLENKEYDGYTKYEKLKLEKEKNRLERFFLGVKDLENLPDVLVVVDPTKEQIAVKEANQMGIPVVALIDTNGNPDDVDIPIPVNDDAVNSVKFVLEELIKAYKLGQKGQ